MDENIEAYDELRRRLERTHQVLGRMSTKLCKAKRRNRKLRRQLETERRKRRAWAARHDDLARQIDRLETRLLHAAERMADDAELADQQLAAARHQIMELQATLAARYATDGQPTDEDRGTA
jgi:predicted  nucleic acid-binding Zn-ribbon protein